MADSITITAIVGAVGGVAAKFAEKAWDSGEKWIQSYYMNHQVKAQEKAIENCLDFLNNLTERIKMLEYKATTSDTILSSLNHPAFSIILQNAMISASQTDNQEKHKLLARLVADRLKAEPESIFALTSKMACDAITYMTSNQMKILGLVTGVRYMKPGKTLSKNEYFMFLLMSLEKFSHIRPTSLDYDHLEALSCLKLESDISNDLIHLLSIKNKNFDAYNFSNQPFGMTLLEIWNEYDLRRAQLTSVGQLIGFMVSEQVTGNQINMDIWK